ncbi:MAG: GNAT family N-acetyltransferase [Pseudomonadota bacterium]
MNIAVRQATAQDVDFILACNIAMAQETEDVGIAPTTLEAGIRYLLDSPSEGFYLIAEQDQAPVGTLMVTFEWSDWRNGRFWWIQSVYVVPEARRKRAYAAMHEQVLQSARKDHQSCGIRLYVEKDNTIAMQTYRNLGMHETHYRLYEELF